MNLRGLIEQLKNYPPDTALVAWDPDAEAVVEVSGLLFHPTLKYLAISGDETHTGAALEIQTDAE